MSGLELLPDPSLLALSDPPGEHTPLLGLGASIEFRIFGRPSPKGSKKGTGIIYRDRQGRPHERMIDDSKHERPWERDVISYAKEAVARLGWIKLTGPVLLEIWFYRAPPKSPLWKAQGVPDVIPDADKLARSLGDALTGILYDDDKRVTDLIVRKRHGRPGAYVRVTGLVELAKPRRRS